MKRKKSTKKLSWKRLKKMRLKRGLTQDAVADELGIPWRTYQEWELGRRKPSAAGIRILMDFLEED